MATRIPLRLFMGASLLGIAACSSEGSIDPPPAAITLDALDDVPAPDAAGEATEPTGTTPLVDTTSMTLYDAPFPSDLRRTADGHVDWSGFPNPNKIGLVDDYVAFAGKALDGFGLTPAVTFRFDGAIDLGTVPSSSDTTASGSAIQIVAVDPESPDYGKRTPLTRAWWGTQASIFVPHNSLTIEPVFGIPLREGTRYAAFVTTKVKDPKGRPLQQNGLVADGLAGQGALAEVLAPLRAWLDTQPGVVAADIAVATVFTTGHPTAELRAVRKFIKDAPAPLVTDIKLANGDKGTYALYEGHYDAPNFQAGAKPYDQDGDFRFSEDGTPIVATTEHIRFALAVPRDLPMPEKGWPVALYGHGTGGDWKTFLNEQPHPVGVELMKLGMAVVSIDQPLHGDRWFESHPATNLDIQSFNFFNPAAGRSNFRQSAADVMVLSRVAHDTLKVPADVAATGAEVLFDSERVYFFGHSHGGLSGAMVAALEPDFRGYVLSGAGAGLSNTILLRKEPYDIAKILRQALAMDNEYELSIWHPFVSLIQNLADATDPLSYAPFYLRRGDGLVPPNVLLTEGTLDVDTPAITTDTLAAAAQIPILNPQVHDSPAHKLLGLSLAYAPLSGNFGAEGKATAILRQYPGASHFVVFQDSEAVKLYSGFLSSLLTDVVAKIQ